MTMKKTFGTGFDAAAGATDRARYKRWYDATSRVADGRR
jgi:hypothetical protein